MLLVLVGDLDCLFSLVVVGSSVLARLREAERSFFTESVTGMAVSYTHLTLPTKRIV